jgi:acyl-CoA synthetase (AMP-forming)/AMP-acid ligase II
MALGGRNAVEALFGGRLEGLLTSGVIDVAAGRTLMSDDIRREVRETQELLAAAGLRPGDVTTIWTEPVSAFIVNFLAAVAADVVAVPLDAHQSEPELVRRVRLVGAQAVLADPSRQHELSWANEAPIAVLPGHAGRLPPASIPGYPSDAAMVLFTSGSTGPSKAAVITHRGLAQNAIATAEWQQCTAVDVIAGTISMFHCFAILHTVLAPFLAGAGMVALSPFSPTRTVEAAERFPLTIIPGTPAMFEMLLERVAGRSIDWRALRCGCSGGSLLRAETQARFLDATGAPLLNGYGITEATSFVASPPIGQRDQAAHSMGYPVSGVSCRISDPDDHGAGELEVGGVSVMAGYLSDPVATSAVITTDGWLRTGDRVRIADDGELFYVGRIKNVINRGGEKIHPEHIEAAIGGPAWVRYLVAVGVPDRVLGERIAVVIEAPERDFDESELRTQAERLLARPERPDWYLRVDAIPRTSTGKLSLVAAQELANRLTGGEDETPGPPHG